MDYILPELGEGITTALVTKVLVKRGDAITADQPVLELETNKAVIELASEASGTVDEVRVQEGQEIEVGSVLFTYEGGVDTPRSEEPVASTPEERPPEPEPQKREAPLAARPAVRTDVPASPSVRRLARKMGIDLVEVAGSGPHDRVSAADLKRHAAAPQAGPEAAPVLPDFGKWGDVQIKTMTGIRHATAKQLSLSWEQIPRVTHHDKADITEIEVLRKKYAPRAEALGGKLTMAVMVVKIAVHALKMFPQFNASINMARKEIIYKDYYNVGIAIATDRGLLVPGIKDADKKNMLEIAVEITEMAERARAGKIGLEELQGNTFTITNIGRIGGMYFTPIINFPEVAILGMARAFQEPALIDGVLVNRTMLPLSLSYDHRLIDGADAAAFLKWVVQAVQEPLLLSLEG